MFKYDIILYHKNNNDYLKAIIDNKNEKTLKRFI